MRRRPFLLSTLVTGAATAAALTGVAPAVSTAAAAVAAHPVPVSLGHQIRAGLPTPPTNTQCLTHYGIHCYGPAQYDNAYGMTTLFGTGDTGKGRTIAIVDSFGSPTIAHDLHVFDQTFGLQDPPSLTVIQPAGPVPPFDPTDADMNGWAFETTLDVEYAHAFAPDAKIVLAETPVSETEGVTGFPEIVKAENYIVDHRMADVISQSFGATENTFPTAQSLLQLRSAFKNAAANGVTVLGASGDNGATDAEADGTTLYPYRVNSWPSSDPLVTSIGGTQLDLDDAGNRLAPDAVWNDGYGAGGGGLSEIFARPKFQNRVQNVVGDQRGTPDISMSAAVDGAAIVYYTFDPTDVGYNLVGGTSEATPIFAGIVADAAQINHGRLGNINAELYRLAERPAKRSGIVDVTTGNNSFNGVTGYDATAGYDLASGWGTIYAPVFVRQLAYAAGDW